MANLVTHFEIYADKPGPLADFYRELFGWEVNKAPGVDYWRIQTGTSPAAGLGGGITYRPMPGPRHWAYYVQVASLDETIAAVERLGGSVVRPRTAVPKTAWFAFVADPAGNIFGIWQADPTAFPPPEPD